MSNERCNRRPDPCRRLPQIPSYLQPKIWGEFFHRDIKNAIQKTLKLQYCFGSLALRLSEHSGKSEREEESNCAFSPFPLSRCNKFSEISGWSILRLVFVRSFNSPLVGLIPKSKRQKTDHRLTGDRGSRWPVRLG